MPSGYVGRPGEVCRGEVQAVRKVDDRIRPRYPAMPMGSSILTKMQVELGSSQSSENMRTGTHDHASRTLQQTKVFSRRQFISQRAPKASFGFGTRRFVVVQ